MSTRSTRARKDVRHLTDAQVRAIRRKYSKGRSQRELGEEYGVSPRTIGRITRGEVRVDAGGEVGTRKRSKLTPRKIVGVRRRYANGQATQADLARELGISAAAISRLVRGKTFSGIGGPTVDVGALPHGRKLTPRQVLDVARSDRPAAELARKYGVTRQAISALRHRWADRADPGGKKSRR